MKQFHTANSALYFFFFLFFGGPWSELLPVDVSESELEEEEDEEEEEEELEESSLSLLLLSSFSEEDNELDESPLSDDESLEELSESLLLPLLLEPLEDFDLNDSAKGKVCVITHTCSVKDTEVGSQTTPKIVKLKKRKQLQADF